MIILHRRERERENETLRIRGLSQEPPKPLKSNRSGFGSAPEAAGLRRHKRLVNLRSVVSITFYRFWNALQCQVRQCCEILRRLQNVVGKFIFGTVCHARRKKINVVERGGGVLLSSANNSKTLHIIEVNTNAPGHITGEYVLNSVDSTRFLGFVLVRFVLFWFVFVSFLKKEFDPCPGSRFRTGDAFRTATSN